MRIRPWSLLAVVGGLAVGAAPAGAQGGLCDTGATEVRTLNFVGNTEFSDAELEIRIATSATSRLYRMVRFLGQRRCLDRDELPLDLLRLQKIYQRRGYPDVLVQLDTTTLKPRVMAVSFEITEGEPTLIDSVGITGLDSVRRADDVRKAVTMEQGGLFDQDELDRVVSAMRFALQNAGYPGGDVLVNAEADSLRHRATVTFAVQAGPLARVREVLVRVTVDTLRQQEISNDVVRRLMGVSPGDTFSVQRQLLDSRSVLGATDAYSHVDVRVATDSNGAIPADSLVTVVASLREQEMREVRVGIGWGTLDCFRATGTMTHRNFLGGARQLQLTANVSKIGVGYPLDGFPSLCRPEVRGDAYSDTLNYRVAATLRYPLLFGLPPRYVPTLSLFSERRSEYHTYIRSVPIGGAASLTWDSRLRVPITLSYQIEYGRTEAQPAIYCGVFNLCTTEERERVRRSLRQAIVGVSVVRDRSPVGGSVEQLDVRHASRLVLSDPTIQFTRLLGEVRRSWFLRRGDVEVAARVRGGIILGSRLAIVGTHSVAQYVPPSERLFAGGPNTVRGFRFNELGPALYLVDVYDTVTASGDTVFYRTPNDTTVRRSIPTGGNALIVANLEARLPSPVLRSYLRYVVFIDAGNVWNRGTEGGSATGGGIKVTPGVGMRITSPIGPISIDLGYNPYDRRAGAAYYDQPIQESGVALLYCVSPGNTLRVVPGATGEPPRQLETSGTCGATFRPPPPRNWLQRLTLSFNIGQAF